MPPKPMPEEEKEPVDNAQEEGAEPDQKDGESMAGGVDEAYIKEASQAVADLSPGDFKSMSGLKVPTDADDGEEVHVLLTGTAKGGFLTDVMGAETVPMMDEGKDEGKSRIKIMIMGGNEEGKPK